MTNGPVDGTSSGSTEPPVAAPPAPSFPAASLSTGPDGAWTLGGQWTLAGLGPLLKAQGLPDPTRYTAGTAIDPTTPLTLDGSALDSIDTVGAWVLHRSLGARSAGAALRGWPAQAQALMTQVQADPGAPLPEPPRHRLLPRIGRRAVAVAAQGKAFLHFLGETGLAALTMLRHRRLWRLRTVWHEVQIGGYEALPIIGLTSFLLGVVVAYQGADQLRHYGANVFVVELVGYAMLREFAPLISAIIIAGRSGSAYAAQIGTMVVAEEVDALRTIGVDPLQRLVVPKIVALALALPLLTVFADIAGVFGGMVMARSQLGIGFAEFADRFGRVMQGSALLVGVGKSVVFALIIATIGCFQGLRTGGSADSVGRQTTQSVVQSIFLVIVADALFSIAFNVLDL